MFIVCFENGLNDASILTDYDLMIDNVIHDDKLGHVKDTLLYQIGDFWHFISNPVHNQVLASLKYKKMVRK